jgi:chitin disaccharide deacetylase
MLIINADDWGRSVAETDAALKCYRERRITSVSAMVLMQDSKRAARLAKEYQLNDVGLHLNFSEEFTDKSCSETLKAHHRRIIRFLKRGKYAQLLYNPFLRKAFAYCYHAQVEEFVRLFEKSPSHIDGHHHMHLCANLLLAWRKKHVEPNLPLAGRSLASSSISSPGLFFRPDPVHSGKKTGSSRGLGEVKQCGTHDTPDC